MADLDSIPSPVFIPKYFTDFSAGNLLNLKGFEIFLDLFWVLISQLRQITDHRRALFLLCVRIRIRWRRQCCQLFPTIQLILIFPHSVSTFSFTFVWRNLPGITLCYSLSWHSERGKMSWTWERNRRKGLLCSDIGTYSWRINSTGCVIESHKYQMEHSTAYLWKVRGLYFNLNELECVKKCSDWTFDTRFK